MIHFEAEMGLEKKGEGFQGWKMGLPVKEPVPDEALLCPFAAEHGTVSYGNLEDEGEVSSLLSAPKGPHS